MAGAGCSNIGTLVPRGAYTWQAQTIMPSTTLPSHASMLSGVTPSVHGITWDEYQPARGPIPVPTIFSVARAAGLRTVMVVGKDKFRQLDIPGSVDRFVLAGPTDEEVSRAAVVQAQMGFELMFVHLPQTDLTGHAQGWMSAAYLDAVGGADRAIGRVLDALPPDTTVIITADHGGHANNHGTNSGSDMTIPWLVVGPRVMAGRVLGRVSTVDTAATAAGVLRLRMPAGVSGRVVTEAFAVDAFSDRVVAVH
jgi:arylsulfatase A-like enzyme